MNKANGLFQRAAETGWIMDVLRDSEVGKTIPYSKLSEACGKDVQREGRSNLNSARRILEREDGIVFDVKLGEGLIRCDDAGVVKQLPGITRRIHRMARKGRERSVCIRSVNSLSKDQRMQLLCHQSYYSLIEVATRTKKVKALENKLSQSRKELNFGEMLAALQGKDEE